MARLQVMTANALRLAADNYNDTTAFVQILQQNSLNDLIINAPINTTTSAFADVNDNQIVLKVTDGIKVGWLIQFTGIDGLWTVTNIVQNYSVPGGLPFCSCQPNRILPPTGQRLSTIVSLAPSLSVQIFPGQPVVFSCAVPTTIVLPRQPPASQKGRVS